MNNYNLPHSGSNNWGSNLNIILRDLQNNVSDLQTKVNAQINGSIAALTFPYGGSGFVGSTGDFNVGYDGSILEVSCIGTIYFGGRERVLYTYTASEPLNCRVSTSLNEGYNYVYLKFDTSNKSITVEASKSFKTEWSYIMIGVLDPDKRFYKKVFVSTKTEMQHIDEDSRRHVEILTSSIGASDSGLIFGSTPNITYYADGVGYSLNTVSEEKMDQISFSTVDPVFKKVFYDELSDDGKIISSNSSSSVNYNVFRVLFTLDGKFYKQYYYREENLGYDISSENTIKNLGFSNEIEFLSGSGFVEVCRAIKIGDKFYVFKSENNGLWGLPSASLWHGYTGLISTNQISFNNSQGSASQFTLSQNNPENRRYVFPQTTSRSQQRASTYNLRNSVATTSDLSLTPGTENFPVSDILINDYAGDKSIIWDIADGNELDIRCQIGGEYYSSLHLNNYGFSININESSQRQPTSSLEVLDDSFSVDTDLIYLAANNSVELSADGNITLGSEYISLTADSEYNLTVNGPITKTSADKIQLITKNKKWIFDGTMLTLPEDHFIELAQEELIITSRADHGIFDITGGYETFKANNISIQSGYDITFMSDRRHKENINLLKNNSLEIVRNTPVVSYNYIGSTNPQIGIISQDLDTCLNEYEKQCFIQIIQENQIPDCKRLKETKLVYILWKALQEEMEKREALEAKINKLLGE